MSRRFRTADQSDADKIVALHQLPHAWGSGPIPTVDQVRSHLATTEDPVFIVERDGEVAGYVFLKVEETWLIEVREIIVAEPGHGDAQYAMDEALRWAFNHIGARRIYTAVVVSNDRASRFYERFGFKLEGVWREGFRHENGAFSDLRFYGLLQREYVPLVTIE